jgi:hypothetical protein
MSVGPLGPFTSYGVCGSRGRDRGGFTGFLGAFQRLGVTPDGSGVVFELTDEFSGLGRGLLPVAQRGMYYVRADGSGLRRLGPASQVPTVILVQQTFSRWGTGNFAFDPTGRQFTYPDLGPDDAGNDAPQVFVHHLATGERRQLTRLHHVAETDGPPDVSGPQFIDARTIVFNRFAALPDRVTTLTVDTADSQVSDVPTVALPGGTLIPVFQIVGAQWRAVYEDLRGEAVNSDPPNWTGVREVFVVDGPTVLQLTDFRRVDTSADPPFFSTRDQRAYFTASADPLGSNPSHDCQIFSMEPVTRDLRQVTFFREGGDDHLTGCKSSPLPNGCRSDLVGQNPATGTIYFSSQCDPLGRNPNGNQLFAIQADGTGLQQLTNASGFVQGADRTAEVEVVEALPLWAYAPPR